MAGGSGGEHFKTRQRRSRRAVLIVPLVVVVVILGLVAAVLIRAATLAVPAPTARVTAAFPARVDGPPPSVALPADGQSEVATAGGVVLARAGAPTPQPLASITKVMTAYLVLQDHPLAPGQAGPDVVISPAEAATLPQRESEGQSLITVYAGEHLSEQQALEALLVPSADNIADALADFDAGSVTAFVAKMNSTARALGMTQTTYTGASGYDPGSQSTAADQLILARAAMRQPVLASIVALPSVVLPGVGKVSNYNTLVGQDGFSGIKTGSTNAAGGCLLWSVTRPVAGTPVTLYGVVLGQRSGPYITAALAAARSVTDAAYRVFSVHTVVPAGTTVLDVERAGRHTRAVTSAALSTIDPPGTAVHVQVATAAPTRDSVPATVTLVTPDGRASTPVHLDTPLAPPSFGWRLAHAL